MRTLINADCIEHLATMDECTIDALVTDPPYGLSAFKPHDVAEIISSWLEDGTHTFNRAGFVGHSWDSFVPPPSLWREVYRVMKHGAHGLVFASARTHDLMGLSLRLAGFEIRDCVQWIYINGFPKSPHYLKPSYEPAILVRKQVDGTIENNVLTHGVGALNIDGCRLRGCIPYKGYSRSLDGVFKGCNTSTDTYNRNRHKGAYPPNVIFDEPPLARLGDKQRFFYCAKSQPNERHSGIERNTHPTVKPINLMRYLCRLITPSEGLILDPFMGSGSTGIAAHLEGFDFIGIERELEYFQISEQRIKHWAGQVSYELNETPTDDQLSLFK